jgi:hypothetical protein
MSMEYIREFYKVPAKRGAKVEYLASDGELIEATIVGSSGAYLLVKLGNNKHTSRMHPTWGLKYLPDGPEFDRHCDDIGESQ